MPVDEYGRETNHVCEQCDKPHRRTGSSKLCDECRDERDREAIRAKINRRNGRPKAKTSGRRQIGRYDVHFFSNAHEEDYLLITDSIRKAKMEGRTQMDWLREALIEHAKRD